MLSRVGEPRKTTGKSVLLILSLWKYRSLHRKGKIVYLFRILSPINRDLVIKNPVANDSNLTLFL